MARRLPILPLARMALLGLCILTSTLTAQPPAAQPQPGGPPVNPGTIKSGEKRNLEDYQNLTNELRKLAQRWKNSNNPEDQARAQIIEDALKRAEERGVKNLFEEIIGGLDGKNDPSSSDLARLIAKDKELNKAIQEIIDILESDDALTKLRKEIETTEKLVKDVKQLKADQENHNALNQRPNSDPMKQANAQKDLANRTQDLANKVGGKKDDPKDPANANKPENKENQAKGDPKGGEKPSESKPDSQQAKAEPKDANANPMDPKSPSGEQKPMPADMKSDGGDKPMPKAGEPMAGEPKPGEQKPMPKGDKPPMEGQSKPPNDDMKGAQKPSDMQAGGEPKPSPMSPMSPKDSQQGDSKGKPSPSSPMSPMPMNPMEQAQKPKDPAEKNLQDAVPDQKGAEQDLKNNDKPNATKKEEQAIEKIDKALEELEKRLKQLREKEQAKKLDDLEQRIEAMLRKQRAVRAATKNINDAIVARKGTGMPETADVQKAQVQGNVEAELVADAEDALKLLKDEGSAVVFAGVLREVRSDMESVRDRLNKGNVGEDTIYVEDQIIVQLERMLEAVKKQKKNLQSQPMPPMEGGPTPDQKKELIELVEQLKLLKELQLQVNDRTKRFGDKVKDGPQATDADLANDIRKLGERQKTIQQMLHDLATKAKQ